MNFQVFHMNPGKKLKKKDVNNDLSHFMPVFPNTYVCRVKSNAQNPESRIYNYVLHFVNNSLYFTGFRTHAVIEVFGFT